MSGPDEWLGAVFESTDEARLAETEDDDEHLSPGGRVVEVLSQHLCQGWLDGYLLTGRHGLFRLLRGVRSHRPDYPLTSHVCVRTTTARRIRIRGSWTTSPTSDPRWCRAYGRTIGTDGRRNYRARVNHVRRRRADDRAQ